MEDVCTIYIVRHGQSEANLQGLYGLDTKLTEKGKEQAKLLAQELHGVHVDAIFSSPLIRAKETAEIIALEHQLAISVRNALRERTYGVIEGRRGEEIQEELKEIHQLRDSLPYEEWKSVSMGEGYETDEQIMSRYIIELREIALAYLGKTVLLVSHVSIMKTLLIHLGFTTRKELKGQAFANTGYLKLQSDGIDFFVLETNGLNKHTVT